MRLWTLRRLSSKLENALRPRKELQDEEESIAAASDHEAAPVPVQASIPVPDASDPGAFVAASLKSAVNINLFWGVHAIKVF